MHRARDRVDYEPWLADLEAACESLELSSEARRCAAEIFLEDVPAADRSRRAALGASVYAGSLVAGEGRTQGAVADATDVSRLAIQHHWKDRLEAAGLEAPSW